MYVATTQHLNCRGQESKPHSLKFTFLTPVTLKQSQGHQTFNDNVDPKLGYKHAKFERSCFDGVCQKANIKGFSVSFVFFKQGNLSITSLEHVQKNQN